MSIIDFYGAIHIKWCKISKETIADANADVHCEWTFSKFSSCEDTNDCESGKVSV